MFICRILKAECRLSLTLLPYLIFLVSDGKGEKRVTPLPSHLDIRNIIYYDSHVSRSNLLQREKGGAINKDIWRERGNKGKGVNLKGEKKMRKLRKILAVSMLSLSLTMSVGIVSWASNQTDRWQGTGDSWKLLNEARNGYIMNSWFQDLDSSWYMLGADGTMYSGLVTDQSTGKSYLLNTVHDGTYGRMLHVNGTYTINGKSVYLEFNQQNDGTFGAITSGLSEARSSGVGEVSLPSIPTDSATQPVVSPEPVETPGETTPPSGGGALTLDDLFIMPEPGQTAVGGPVADNMEGEHR